MISDFPSHLIEKAVFLCKEPAWPCDDTAEVVAWLSSQEYAVLGLELWDDHNGQPHWILTSSHQGECSGDWTQYVKSCAEHAQEAIEKYGVPGLLFNLSWVSHDEYLLLRKRHSSCP